MHAAGEGESFEGEGIDGVPSNEGVVAGENVRVRVGNFVEQVAGEVGGGEFGVHGDEGSEDEGVEEAAELDDVGVELGAA